ncbi:hypothetical protein JZ751_009203 [Albula glossodonta]|uniref:Uncharacterized protein n=1 Tax=Albula glossodonta TaxID=121402 RepID=A0A8T2N3N9_9TELE|nr:hypothetical protein JZ751_009203 [Albula glossodonta]
MTELRPLTLGFLHFNFVSIDGVEFQYHRFVGRVVVFEVDKAKPALLAGLFVANDFSLLDRTKLRKIFVEVLIFHVVFKPANKYFLYLGKGLRFSGIFPGHGSFQLHVVAIYYMWPGSHCRVGLLRSRVGHKAETTRAL